MESRPSIDTFRMSGAASMVRKSGKKGIRGTDGWERYMYLCAEKLSIWSDLIRA